jgi:hypothetical protein
VHNGTPALRQPAYLSGRIADAPERPVGVDCGAGASTRFDCSTRPQSAKTPLLAEPLRYGSLIRLVKTQPHRSVHPTEARFCIP